VTDTNPSAPATDFEQAETTTSALSKPPILTNCDKAEKQETPVKLAQKRRLLRVPFTVSRLMEFKVITGVNWSPGINNPFRQLGRTPRRTRIAAGPNSAIVGARAWPISFR
jgi:hypothetical protein